jgi:hypothetical protein
MMERSALACWGAIHPALLAAFQALCSIAALIGLSPQPDPQP